MRRLLGFAASALLAAALGGCAALPSGVDRPVSSAIAASADAPLVRIAQASLPAGDGRVSAFGLLADPADALEARLALVRRAVASIDVQTFLFASDRTGDELRGELARAAARGVRVRVLVDDLLATGQDALWSAFAARPGIEVRLFNPLPVRGGGFVRRIAFSLHHLPRINQRMHNKLFVVDGTFAIVGGRNIADEYFARRDAATDFVDLDVVAAGAVIADLSAAFDRYWNSDAAYPVQWLAQQGGDAKPGADISASHSVDAVPAVVTSGEDARFAMQLAGGRVALEPAAVQLLLDAPAKVGSERRGEVSAGWLDLVRNAAHGALIASPYVVPDNEMMASLGAAAARTGSVVLVTNSAGTSDEPFAHFAYARRRGKLLDAGVALHEMMPAPAAVSAAASSPARAESAWSALRGSFGRLHAKVAVVDGRQLFIGSMNMDRRSALCNTEVALVVDSVALGEQAAALLAGWRDRGAWRLVRGDASRALGWASPRDGAERVDAIEPNAAPPGFARLVGWLAEDWL